MCKKLIFQNACICKAGHICNDCTQLMPELNYKFCNICGEETVTHCSACNTAIQGALVRYDELFQQWSVERNLNFEPAYCPECGTPFPWTQERLHAAQGIIDMLDELSDEQKEELKKIIPDLTVERPRTQLSTLLLAKAFEKISSFGKEFLIKWLNDNAVATVLELLHKSNCL